MFKAIFGFSLQVTEKVCITLSTRSSSLLTNIGDKQSGLRSVFDFLVVASSVSGVATQFLASSPPFAALLNTPHFITGFGTHRAVLSIHFSAETYPNIDRKQLYQAAWRFFSDKISLHPLEEVAEQKVAWSPLIQRHFQDLIEFLKYLALWRDSSSGRTFFARESTIKKTLLALQQSAKSQQSKLDGLLGLEKTSAEEERTAGKLFVSFSETWEEWD